MLRVGGLNLNHFPLIWSRIMFSKDRIPNKCELLNFVSVRNQKFQIHLKKQASRIDFTYPIYRFILATGRGHFGRSLGFSDFSKGSPLWNDENKSCLNDFERFQEIQKQADSESYSSLCHVEPRNLSWSPYMWPRWSGPLNDYLHFWHQRPLIDWNESELYNGPFSF